MSFRAFGPKQSPVFALSVPATQVNQVTPAGFATGGNQVRVTNTGATNVIIAFYTNADGVPTLTIPSSTAGTGTAGSACFNANNRCFVTIVLKGTEKQISLPITCDSFAAIGDAAGPSIIYVQRGDGSV